VCVGTDAEGGVLVNLEHAGSVSVEGDPGRVRGLLGEVLVGLSASPWSHEALLGLHTMGDALGADLPGVEAALNAAALVAALDASSDHRQAQVGAAGSLAAMRAVEAGVEPHVDVAFAGAPGDALRCVVGACVPDRSGVAVIAAGLEGARWRVEVSADGAAVVSGHAGDAPLRMAVHVDARPEVVTALAADLAAAAGPVETEPPTEVLEASPEAGGAPGCAPVEEVGTVAAQAGPVPGRPGRPAHASALSASEPAAVEVGVLGPVVVSGGAGVGAVESSRRRPALALLAYLATRSRPVSAAEIAAGLWPLDTGRDSLGEATRGTLANLMTKARKIVGDEAVVSVGGTYQLAPGLVSCDWSRLDAMVRAAGAERGPPAAAAYRRALEVVRGTPFEGSLADKHYEWVGAEKLDMHMANRVVDAAEALAEIALEQGDHATVLWAVKRGLALAPSREALYQAWMHALGCSGDAQRLKDVYGRCCSMLRSEIHATEAPSAETKLI